jgi:hypothetical protein
MSQPPEPRDPYRPVPPSPPGGWGPVAWWDGRTPDQVRADRPESVARLVQVMVLGAVLELALGVLALATLDSALLLAVEDLREVAAQTGGDATSLASLVRQVAVVAVVLGTLVSLGLWGLFARLFSRAAGRTVGTVLGAVNLVFSLGAVLGGGLLEGVLRLGYLAVVVAGLVLLWRPATTLWWRRVAAARAATGQS